MVKERLLSFIVPAFNAAETLAETLDSILAQELPIPFEVVIVDDASTDRTGDVIGAYASGYPGLVVAGRNEVNLGGGATRNLAISRARGELLYMVDADNLLSAGLAGTLLRALDESTLESAAPERLCFFERDPATSTHEWTMAHDDGISGQSELFRTIRVPASSGNYLFTRSLYEAAGGYEHAFGALDTWVFGVKHVLFGYPTLVVRGTSYFHRAGRDSYWVREERLGHNDRHAVSFLKRESALLSVDVARKVARLVPGDPIFEYLEAGCFVPGARLPSFYARWKRRGRTTT